MNVNDLISKWEIVEKEKSVSEPIQIENDGYFTESLFCIKYKGTIYEYGQLLTTFSNEEIDRINRVMSKNVDVKELMEKMSVYLFDLEEIYCDYCETCGDMNAQYEGIWNGIEISWNVNCYNGTYIEYNVEDSVMMEKLLECVDRCDMFRYLINFQEGLYDEWVDGMEVYKVEGFDNE